MSNITENSQSFAIFRDINVALLAEKTGGAATVTPDAIVACWENGGVRIEVRDGVTSWEWRDNLRYDAHIIPDSTVLLDPKKATVVFPAGENGSVQGLTFSNGRISRFVSKAVSLSDPLRPAATYARDVFVARQEALVK